MRAACVVEVDPAYLASFQRSNIFKLIDVATLIFQQPPKPFDEDVVHDRVEDVRDSVISYGIFQGGHAKISLQGVRLAPGQHLP